MQLICECELRARSPFVIPWITIDATHMRMWVESYNSLVGTDTTADATHMWMWVESCIIESAFEPWKDATHMWMWVESYV